MGNFHGLARPARGRLMLRAAAASVGLSLLFVVVYGSTNWLTSLRSDVGTWYFQWERYIPFVPLMVIPYMSIDLFFAAAPFVCADGRELKTYSRRIALAIGLAGLCFLAMPLKLGVERPRLEGWLGAAFGWFFAADRPYNLCPSLHIALRTILAETYDRHSRGVWRVAAAVWFSLVGLSTLLTYQHHAVDVAGGFLLAAVCFYLVPALPQTRTVTLNRRIGAYYLLSTAVAGVAAILLWPWGSILLWPAAACLIAASGYFALGPTIYRKTGGRLPLSTRVVLAPLLFGQELSLRYYRRQCNAWDEVAPNVWLGRQLSAREAARAIAAGVTSVLDLTAEFSEPAPLRELNYLNVPILDLTAPTPRQIEHCVAFINEHAQHGVVYVHCKIGYSRSAVVVGSYLLAKGLVDSANEAITRLRAVRPSIVIRPEAARALIDFEESRSPAPASRSPAVRLPAASSSERP